MFDSVLPAVLFEKLRVGRIDRFYHPAPRGLGKKLHGVAAELLTGFLGRLGESAGNGHVGTKDDHMNIL
jgi:hypothetical protein